MRNVGGVVGDTANCAKLRIFHVTAVPLDVSPAPITYGSLNAFMGGLMEEPRKGGRLVLCNMAVW